MSYSSVIDYLYGLQKHGIKLGLETMRLLLDRMGNPQASLQVFHVGGTNGKGSTASMAAAVLHCAGRRVGLYTSPHLVDFRERIRVNGQMITEERVEALLAQLRSVLTDDLHPTFFEMTTALAFLHFAQSAVDVAVLEVGLGGRFDATNVIEQPLACAITTIGMDHQEYLGNSEEAIAFEKGGIIKPCVPVVIGRMGIDAEQVLSKLAKDRSAPFWRLGREFSVEEDRAGRLLYRGQTRVIEGVTCGLVGRHQWDNAACALALLEAADQRGITVDEGAVLEGLRTVSWEGRLETIDEEPHVVLDGAHNPAAAEVLAQYLTDYAIQHPVSRIILVWGMMRDKDHRGFITPLLPVVSEIVVTQAALTRSATVHELRAALQEWSGPVLEAILPTDALTLARSRAMSQDLICIAGSLMLLGDIKAAMRGCGLSPIRG
ncbi:MAG: bifunctional folylpolyglutamate synthase/dihydrofolate synthase [Nitrospira sp.]|nr:bifunctional folylpolyglutamate synthase/dihydrofolate synthase [Nitrospira sp.]MDH4302721.1 bifunctional folylpolyglutamate synthase/dihydrofolate synthase [Nitrospira sp.]MDH5194040.1 bifunctional folylpolyglutamate synthase/dihydrofolate synthase [Nitrospira sp.]